MRRGIQEGTVRRGIQEGLWEKRSSERDQDSCTLMVTVLMLHCHGYCLISTLMVTVLFPLSWLLFYFHSYGYCFISTLMVTVLFPLSWLLFYFRCHC